MSARLTSSRVSALCAASLLAMASTCEQCQPVGDPRRGNVDRISDVVVVAAADGHSYAVSANPELQHLRVLDLTDGRFLTAPNRFFPLSIPVGDETRRLAVAVDARTQTDDPTRVYALDNASDLVQVVRVTDDAALPAFDVVHEAAAGRAPVDVAALRIADDTVVVAVSLPDTGSLRLLTLVNDALTGSVDVDLTAALQREGALAHPGELVADPLGRAFVVGDAVQPVIYAVELDDALTPAVARVVDVGGPVQGLAAGVVDVGDGLAPVVLALRADAPAAMLVRLFRPGFVEDRYALLGGTALPAPAAVAYVPDARASAAPTTVCCEGLSAAQIAAGEATAAFSSVTLIDGRLLYLQLAAASLDGVALEGDRRVVRLVDDDPLPPSPPEGIDVNTEANLWVPPAGGESLRPTVSFATVDNLGSPPFVPLVGAALLLVWEGELPLATGLGGAFAPGPRAFEVAVDLPRRGVRVGDLARLVPESQRTGCATSFDARVLAVAGGVLTIAFEGDGSGASPAITEADSTGCLQGAGDVRLTVLAADAFVVTEGGAFRGRLRFGADVDVDSADGRLELAGVRLTVQAAGAGKPLPGSRLAIPLDARVTTMGLDLEAGFGTAAQVPTSIAGGTLIIPDADDATARVPARRVIFSTTGLSSRTGLPGLFTCDEGETTIGLVERFE